MNYKITVCTLICGVILLNSCQKQESNQITPTTKVEKQLNGEEMANQIEDFRSQILSSQKSGETMYFGEALFLLEASFNYFHGFVSEDFISIKTDSLIIPIEYNLLSVLSFDKIEKIFKEINNTLYNNFKSFEAENKHCVLFDFELVATPVGNQLVLIQSMGEINSLKSANAGIDPFHTDDYWHVGYTDYHHDNMGITKPGKCGAYEGSLLGHDHTTRLEWSVKSYYYSHIAASQKSTAAVNVYYTDVVTHYNNDGPELFAGYDTYCISPAEMNYYHHNLCEKIESIEYWYSPQKVFTGICDVDNLLYTSKSGSYLVTSLVTASFGVKHTSTIEPGDILPMP